MAGILVTCGEQRAALAIVRSLGAAGHRVMVGSTTGRSLAGASKHASAEAVLGDPLTQPGSHAHAVARAVAEHGIEIVLPVTEPALLALLPRASDLAPATLPFPDPEAFRRASDKAWVMEAASRVGLGVPEQRIIATRAAARELEVVSEEALVLKPSRSVRGTHRTRVSYVSAGAPMRAAVTALPTEAFPLLVQRRVHGPGTGVFLLRWDGRTVASFAHRRLREKPPSGGVSVLRESVALSADMLARAEALLDLLGWQGVAMVELKVDRATGHPYVMEVNGRFWGSLQLAIDAGVDFPALLVESALGREPSPVHRYRLGVRSRWLMGDLDHLLIRLRRHRGSPDLPPDAPGRWATLAAFAHSFLPPTRTEILRAGDPRPFWREISLWLGSANTTVERPLQSGPEPDCPRIDPDSDSDSDRE